MDEFGETEMSQHFSKPILYKYVEAPGAEPTLIATVGSISTAVLLNGHFPMNLGWFQ